MIERAFEILFVVSFVAPPLTVLAGVILLALPRRIHHAASRPAHAVGT